ncbi:major facilitator superfamily domain-containing protein [Amylocarpus encephaloides]|uniref:Major facilitator superfamily domain-containing protein n=1 Tax=Amylocarpus encephaloides TaxID=45428 RepID=A0A9P8C5F5_9HELO|nr:major facilitator superfamily domain-containing protein [Amylocarpus encephaloides]
MTSHALAFFEVESSPTKDNGEGPAPLAAPEKAFPRVYHSMPHSPDEIELDSIQWGQRLNGPVEPGATTPTGYQTPRVPNDVEMSRPASPVQEVAALQSFSKPPMNRFRMSAVCLMNFTNGLNDSAPGALIPYIEKHYNIGYAVVSLIFVTNAIGFVTAAFFVDAIRARFGRAKTLMISQALMAVGYVAIVCTPPWPVVVASFFLLGLGMAFNLAIGNVFAANLHNNTAMLGAMHGSYGVGGTIAPLIATAMVASGGILWSRYYFLVMGMCIFNCAFASWSFWHYEAELGLPLLTSHEQTASRTQNGPQTKEPGQMANMLKAFRTRTVLLGALFIFAYQGAEVSISGWVISFLITARDGNPASIGYVTAGFWAGITLGRFLLSHPAHKIGEKIFVYGAVVGAAVFQLLVWLVPNVIGNAVAVSIVGLLLGPVYPCATVIFTRAINSKDQVSGLSVISAFGSSGGAVAPFTTGILAQVAGTFVLHPIAIGLFGVMMVCWFALPNVRKRTE